jgi:hypothetical protein
MVPASRIACQEVSWSAIRRYGRQLFPDAVVWHEVDRRSRVPLDAGLAILLVHHLSGRHVLVEADALSAVLFYRDRVTRYAHQVRECLEHDESNSDNKALRLPVAMLEVVDGRWVRVGRRGGVFDLREQTEVSMREMAKGEDGYLQLWSHNVCLLPFVLQLRPLEDGDEHGHEHDQQNHSAGDAER